MEDNNRPTSEFENLVKEATGEIPTVNENKVEQPKDDENEIVVIDDDVTVESTQDTVNTPVEVAKEEVNVETEQKEEPKIEVVEETKEEKPIIKTDDISVVDDGSSVVLPQTKDGVESSIPADINTSTPDSQTIGTIKPDKQKSPIAMLILFGGLIAFILFMPSAIDLFNKYFGTDLNIDSLNNTKKEDNPNPDDGKQDLTIYDIKEDTVIKIDKIDFSGFKKENNDGYKISFYVKNNGSTPYKFEKKLYLEYYDDNKTLIGRTYLENVKEVSGGISNTYSISLDNASYNRATKIELIQRTEDDYPSVNLVNNQLTCTNETNNIVYTFDNNSKLTNIKDMYTYIKGDDTIKYNNDLVSYKSKVANLDKMDGITSVLTETDNGFITTTAIDYQYADYSKLSTNTDYYVKETYAKTISFEMNSKGYSCR